jgi:hypothetical protein
LELNGLPKMGTGLQGVSAGGKISFAYGIQ